MLRKIEVEEKDVEATHSKSLLNIVFCTSLVSPCGRQEEQDIELHPSNGTNRCHTRSLVVRVGGLARGDGVGGVDGVALLDGVCGLRRGGMVREDGAVRVGGTVRVGGVVRGDKVGRV